MSLLDAGFARYKPQDKYEAKMSQVLRIYPQLGVQVILLDELHNALQGTMKQQALFLNCLKRISNLTKIHFAAAGIEKAKLLLTIDDQMTSRFKPFKLPAWTPGDRLGELLTTLENRMPLRHASNLKAPQMMKAIYERAEDSLGDTIDLVRECAVEAVKRCNGEGTECVTLTLVKDIAWTPPSDRKNFAKFRTL